MVSTLVAVIGVDRLGRRVLPLEAGVQVRTQKAMRSPSHIERLRRNRTLHAFSSRPLSAVDGSGSYAELLALLKVICRKGEAAVMS